MFQSKSKIAAKVSTRLNGDAQSNRPVRIKKWYENDLFPVIPTYGIKPADAHNSLRWWFNWAFIRVWSLDSFGFEFAFVCNDHWGIGFVGSLPYIRLVVCIPCPPKVADLCFRYLSRHKKSNF